MRIAIVVDDGAFESECGAFPSVLGVIDDVDQIAVGAHPAALPAPGCCQQVDATFAEVDRVDAAVVPGGLGCERATDDPDLREFLSAPSLNARRCLAGWASRVSAADSALVTLDKPDLHPLAKGSNGEATRRRGVTREGQDDLEVPRQRL